MYGPVALVALGVPEILLEVLLNADVPDEDPLLELPLWP